MRMDEEYSFKTTLLLYWYILGVPICMVLFAYILSLMDLPILVGLSFLLIVMYAGIIGVLIILTSASIYSIRRGRLR